MFLSYVNSHARGDLNDFNNYLGSFPIPIIRPNQFSNLAGDIPNRFLAWGTIKLPLRFQISPMLELRDGFPYFMTDAAQNYVGTPIRTGTRSSLRWIRVSPKTFSLRRSTPCAFR